MDDMLYLEALVYGCYFLVIFASYCLVGFVIYVNKDTEIKLLKTSLDPKKAFRNRKAINDTIQAAVKEKRMALLWPVFLIKSILNNVKKNSEKEEN